MKNPDEMDELIKNRRTSFAGPDHLANAALNSRKANELPEAQRLPMVQQSAFFRDLTA